MKSGLKDFPNDLALRNLPANAGDARDKEMTTHSSVLAWRIPGREEPSRVQFRVTKNQTTE